MMIVLVAAIKASCAELATSYLAVEPRSTDVLARVTLHVRFTTEAFLANRTVDTSRKLGGGRVRRWSHRRRRVINRKLLEQGRIIEALGSRAVLGGGVGQWGWLSEPWGEELVLWEIMLQGTMCDLVVGVESGFGLVGFLWAPRKEAREMPIHRSSWYEAQSVSKKKKKLTQA